MIFHWCPAKDWNADAPFYVSPSLEEEGFIHFSFREQVERTATAIDQGAEGLLLLSVDDTDLNIVVEDCYEIGEAFPHAYSPIPTDAVVAVHPFPPADDGSFQLPEGV